MRQLEPLAPGRGHNTNKEKTNIDDAWISAPSEIFVFKTREEAQQVVQNQFQSIVNIFLCASLVKLTKE